MTPDNTPPLPSDPNSALSGPRTPMEACSSDGLHVRRGFWAYASYGHRM